MPGSTSWRRGQTGEPVPPLAADSPYRLLSYLSVSRGVPVNSRESATPGELTQGWVNSVPVLWADTPAPYRAGLIFRSGWADEHIPTRGIGHLVEHLALSGLGRRPFDFNGYVDAIHTGFTLTGSRTDAREFFRTVTHAIHNLPVERLDDERRILSVESEGRPGSAYDQLLFRRFGAQGLGLNYVREFGLQGLGAGDLAPWALSQYTRGNAVLWMTSPPPLDLEFELPTGPRREFPVWEQVSPQGQTHFVRDGAGVAVQMFVPRTTLSGFADFVVQRRLWDRLRIREAVSYGLSTSIEYYSPDTSIWTIAVDGDQESQAQVEENLLDVLRELASDGANHDELADFHERFRRSLERPDRAFRYMSRMINDVLFGCAMSNSADLDDELLAIDIAETGAWTQTALSTAMFAIPNSSGVIGRQTLALDYGRTTAPLTGRKFRCRNPSDASTVWISDSKIALASNRLDSTEIRWTELVAALQWTDGGRTLVRRDGWSMTLDPRVWLKFLELQAAVDDSIDVTLIVPTGDSLSLDPVPRVRTPVLWHMDVWLIALLVPVLLLVSFLTPGNDKAALLYQAAPSFFIAALLTAELILRAKGKRGGPMPLARKHATPRVFSYIGTGWLWLLALFGFAGGAIGVAITPGGTRIAPMYYGIAALLVGVTASVELIIRWRRRRERAREARTRQRVQTNDRLPVG